MRNRAEFTKLGRSMDDYLKARKPSNSVNRRGGEVSGECAKHLRMKLIGFRLCSEPHPDV